MFMFRMSILLCSVASVGVAGCATSKVTQVPVEANFASLKVDTAVRALPTVTNNVLQPAHYQHVYIDPLDKNAGSLQTITLEDAVTSNVLASSELQVKPLSKIQIDSLKWIVLEQGFARPNEIEGVAGADINANHFSEVNFESNEIAILDRSKLDELVKLASRVSGLFHIVGYADETGLEANNNTLSQDRANAVAAMLIASGVNSSRVQADGAGVSRTYQGLDANRRASITFRVIE